MENVTLRGDIRGGCRKGNAFVRSPSYRYARHNPDSINLPVPVQQTKQFNRLELSDSPKSRFKTISTFSGRLSTDRRQSLIPQRQRAFSFTPDGTPTHVVSSLKACPAISSPSRYQKTPNIAAGGEHVDDEVRLYS